jgi:hydroxyacylglutathione hydrolase
MKAGISAAALTVFRQIKRSDSGCVTYLVGSPDTEECAIVDPLLDIEYVIAEAKKEGFDRITNVIDTHTHADHVSGARNLANRFGLPGVHMHANAGSKFQILPIQDGQTIRLGKTTMLQFIHTPGHTYDHICILVDNSKILTGDTMLIGDVGRIDLGGDPRDKSDKLYDSLHGKLLKLADAIEVYPTHVGTAHHLASTSTSSTIAKERENNGALKLKTKDEFFKYMTKDWPPKPPDYQNIIRLNRGEVTISQLG